MQGGKFYTLDEGGNFQYLTRLSSSNTEIR
uniref:Uncharacterized protein n=1 Tax=Arundo donax TaxID=35708 RepID=A0A0A9CC17_ARUDO